MTGNTPSVKTDWHHKWCTLKNIYIHEVVKGPLYRPMVAIPLSNTHVEHATQCECAGKVKEFYVQKGIPDPQEDVWILKEELKRGRSSAEAYPKRDADITNSLRRKYCVYLGQGIPDPWKTKIMLDNGRDEGPSRGMMRGLFNFERINCPECGAQITILCLKEEGEEKDEHVQKNCEDEDDDDDDDDDEDVKPEKPTKHKVEFKDACVETDQCSNATIHETESSHHKHKVHETESIMHKPRICETESTHSKVKLTEKEEPNCKSASQITCNYPILKVGSAYKKESQISNLSQGCPAHNKTPPLVQSQNSCNIGSPSPTVIPHVLSSIRRKDLSDTNRSAQIQTVNNQSPVLPFVYNNTNCPCHQQLIGFEEKNDHFMEMKLVCAKCEMTKEEKRRKKKKRKHKKKGDLLLIYIFYCIHPRLNHISHINQYPCCIYISVKIYEI
ncbi:UNVERIFIED_CONTAM: hypothetical protein PYX00_007463 [Menopon gallinae]|uniref:Uncharacterized protein n=1 Tax=Menopon gallinae TaxID=328185 RepID=A0AAW2HJF6_9NEOP